jgi:HAD superfamily hydrolase (TIGR01458 family)
VDAVLVGDMGTRFTYEVLNRAFRWLLDGAELVALARTRFYQSREGLVLDCGPYVALLEDATGLTAAVAGKPSPAFFQAGLRRIGIAAAEAAMVGDDLQTDVLPAMDLGMRGIQVRTGKFREDRYAASPRKADHLAADLEAAVALLQVD